ncbi:hypothetical protein F0562_021007 [Nyssa sinensis]|uniref:Uncharacterized protein n=1 Tax=Nyssa sinensis TaxID=561372 RepID=A0A5J5BLF2_9ASTE|nr:hypothetical protein F0562_021007 [Nyssa sinensis]
MATRITKPGLTTTGLVHLIFPQTNSSSSKPNLHQATSEKLSSLQGTPLFTSNQSTLDLTYSSSSLSNPSCTFFTRTQSSSSFSSFMLARAKPGISALSSKPNWGLWHHPFSSIHWKQNCRNHFIKHLDCNIPCLPYLGCHDLKSGTVFQSAIPEGRLPSYGPCAAGTNRSATTTPAPLQSISSLRLSSIDGTSRPAKKSYPQITDQVLDKSADKLQRTLFL